MAVIKSQRVYTCIYPIMLMKGKMKFLKNLFFVLILFPVIAFSKNDSLVPKKVWQTYRTINLPKPAQKARDSWLSKNPDCAFEFYDDNMLEEYIKNLWDGKFYEFYKALPIGVMKADLWRYLVIADQGGYYTDVDTICILPISKWPLTKNLLKNSTNQLIVSLEKNTELAFCQWSFAATKNHPAMIHITNYILESWKKKGIDYDNPHMVHQTTGPTVWTCGLISYLGLDEGTSAETTYKMYLNDSIFRDKVNSLGVFLFEGDFYQGLVSANLFGGDAFGDGYVGWKHDLVNFFSERESQEWKKVWGNLSKPKK